MTWHQLFGSLASRKTVDSRYAYRAAIRLFSASTDQLNDTVAEFDARMKELTDEIRELRAQHARYHESTENHHD